MNGQSSPERCDGVSSIVRNQTTSADDELSVGSGEKSDSEDSSEHDSDDLTARSSFAGKNGRLWFTMCPPSSRTRETIYLSSQVSSRLSFANWEQRSPWHIVAVWTLAIFSVNYWLGPHTATERD